MERPDYTNKCYQTKDDKRHSTIWCTNNLDKETPKDREERIKQIKKNRGVWVWDKGELVKKEEYLDRQPEVDAPQISKWDPECTVIATGMRMSKRELKNYCKQHNKTWEN
jgi:hypothetical protein